MYKGVGGGGGPSVFNIGKGGGTEFFVLFNKKRLIQAIAACLN